MPAQSPAQARLMRAALHGATFPKAREVRQSMTPQQLQDYARGPSVAEALGSDARRAPTKPTKTRG